MSLLETFFPRRNTRGATATSPLAIQSLPLEGKHPLYYYPDLNLLTLDGKTDRYSTATTEGFSDILFRYFLGLRKLTALKETQQAPRTLFIEPWRTCNLKCTYCYAFAGPSDKKRIDADRLALLLKKHPFNRAMVFGGEPLLDVPFLLSLLKSHSWDSFFFSTNGLLLDKKAAQELTSLPNVHFQISLEPDTWTCRLAETGDKQMALLGGKLALLRDSHPNLRITIPSEAQYIPIKKLIGDLEDAITSRQFSIGYWPERSSKPVSWLGRWIQESYELMREDQIGRYQQQLPGHQVATQFHELVQKGFRFFNCNSALGSVAIGPDNLLHGCHELAVVESELDTISSASDAHEIDEEKRVALVWKWVDDMNNPACSQCTARYICGGICFVIDTPLPHSACYFFKDMMRLALTDMVQYEPANVLDLAARSEQKFSQLFAMRAGLSREVNSEKWKRLVSGELPLAEAVELAKRFLKK